MQVGHVHRGVIMSPLPQTSHALPVWVAHVSAESLMCHAELAVWVSDSRMRRDLDGKSCKCEVMIGSSRMGDLVVPKPPCAPTLEGTQRGDVQTPG